MKFNMKDWKKKDDQPDHVIMANKDGHELKIAKKALSPKMREHMESLPLHKDEGGGIPGGSGSPYMDPKSAADVSKGAQGQGVGDQIKQGMDNIKSYFAPGGLVQEVEKFAPLAMLALNKGGNVQRQHYADGTPPGGAKAIPGGSGSPYADTASQAKGDKQSQTETVGDNIKDSWQGLKDAVGFAQGGKVPGRANYAEGTDEGGASQADVQAAQQPADTGQPAPQSPVTINIGGQPSQGAPQQMGNYSFDPRLEAQAGGNQSTPTGDYQNQLRQQRGLPPMPADANTPPQSSTPQQVAPQQAVPPPAGSMAASPAAQTGDDSDDPMQGYAKQMVGAQGLEEKGINAKAAADTAEGQQTANVLSQQLPEQQKRQNEYEGNVANINEEMGNLAMDIQNPNNQIKPSHFFDNMSAGHRILAAIGLALTGGGAALGHTQNAGLAYIDKIMDQDFNAQVHNQNNRLTLLNHYRGMLGDEATAQNVAQAGRQLYLANMIKQVGAQNAGAQANAVKQMMLGQTMNKYAYYNAMAHQSAARAAGDPEAAMANQIQLMRMTGHEDMAKNLESKFIPGEGMATIAPTEKQRSEISDRKVLDQQLQQLQALTQKYGGTIAGIVDPSVKSYATSLASQTLDHYRQTHDQGVFKKTEKDFVGGIISGDPTSALARFTAMPSYNAARLFNTQGLQQTRRDIGLHPFRGGAAAQQQNTYVGPKSWK